MTLLALFGLVAVTLMLICDSFERRSPWFTLAFGGACLMGSAYGFMQGAWPFGCVEGIWAIVKVISWNRHRNDRKRQFDISE
jgi:hypothetical protein